MESIKDLIEKIQHDTNYTREMSELGPYVHEKMEAISFFYLSYGNIYPELGFDDEGIFFKIWPKKDVLTYEPKTYHIPADIFFSKDTVEKVTAMIDTPVPVSGITAEKLDCMCRDFLGTKLIDLGNYRYDHPGRHFPEEKTEINFSLLREGRDFSEELLKDYIRIHLAVINALKSSGNRIAGYQLSNHEEDISVYPGMEQIRIVYVQGTQIPGEHDIIKHFDLTYAKFEEICDAMGM